MLLLCGCCDSAVSSSVLPASPNDNFSSHLMEHRLRLMKAQVTPHQGSAPAAVPEFQAATLCALIHRPTCLRNQTDGFQPGKMSKYPKCFETGAALSFICSNKISLTLSELRTRKPSSPNLQSAIKRHAEDVENHLGRRPLKRLCKQPPVSTCSSKSKPMTETTDHLLI